MENYEYSANSKRNFIIGTLIVHGSIALIFIYFAYEAYNWAQIGEDSWKIIKNNK